MARYQIKANVVSTTLSDGSGVKFHPDERGYFEVPDDFQEAVAALDHGGIPRAREPKAKPNVKE